MIFGIQAFQINNFQRAENSRIFAENLEQEIIETVKIVFEQQEKMSTLCIEKVNDLLASCNIKKSNYQKSKNLYENSLSELEQILSECEELRKNNSDAKAKIRLNQKLGKNLKDHKESLENYKGNYEKMINANYDFEQNVKGFIEILKEQEIKRTDLLKDVLQKFFILQENMEQGHNLNSKNSMSQLEEINSQSDIQENISQISLDFHSELPIMEIKSSVWDKLLYVYEKNYYENMEDYNKIDYAKLVEETQRIILQQEDVDYKKYRENFDNEFESIFNKKSVDTTEINKKCTENLNEIKGRIAALDALENLVDKNNELVISNQEKIKEFEILIEKFIENVYFS